MLEALIATYLPNLVIITVVLAFLVLALFAKIGSGVFLNVFGLHQKFDWKLLAMGVLKGFIFALSLYAVGIVLTGVPYILVEAGFATSGFADFTSIGAPLAIFIAAIYKYIKEANFNYQKTLRVQDEVVPVYGVGEDVAIVESPNEG